ncbi:MAG TPA: carboxylating nicotinate-nucleotide diphosphorylase [Gemmatimonadaceae bacterium]|nr:carboxylating nicotinate-nucleotide diphosphorylase [Gemmatimonadaceae bacterium]
MTIPTPDSPRPERRSTPRTITPLSVAALSGDNMLRFPLDQSHLERIVSAALTEDGAHNDLTTIATILSDRRSRAMLVAKEAGVIAGIPLALEAFRQLDSKVSIRVDVEDGTPVASGTPILFCTGHARALLSAERVALNFMQRLSGIATTTSKFVEAIRGTKARILDTRKTTPGWRQLEKYAVRAGGGTNHRHDLSSAVLIKDNHLSALENDIGLAVKRARDLVPEGIKVEVECDTLDQVRAAIEAKADIILLDNMPAPKMREAVELIAGRAIVEASGGVSLTTVRAIAETGVDWISVGALTHSARAMDLGLDFD